MRASSDGWSGTVRGLVRPLCLLTARRYGTRPVGIHWISHTVMVTQQHCMSRLSRVFDSPASSAASACGPSFAAFLRDGANPMLRWTLSRAPAWAPSEVASLRPRGTRGVGPLGAPWLPPECARRGHSGASAGPVDPPHAATARTPRVPGFQFARSPPAPRRGPARPTRFPKVRWSVDFRPRRHPIVRW
jgi:hypothetical protein